MYTYAKGSQADSDKDWYHGELTKDQAEEALRGGGSSNCFLVRESNGSLVLSLRHHDIKHIKIERGPGWYQLEHHIQSPEKRFSDLNELVSHYCINGIESTSLGIACKKISHHAGMRRLYNCTNQMQNQLNLNKTKPSGMYSKGSPADIVRYHWYHGKITENEATSMLNEMSVDSSCFLVRQAAKDLILSVKAQGLIFHVTIDYTPAGYRLHLQGREEVFKTIPEMITHYLMFPIDQLGTQTLGTACNSQVSTAPLSSPLGISHPWENKTSDAQDAEGYEVVDRILLSKLPPPPWFSTTSLSSPISPSNNIRQRAKTLPYNKHLPPSVHTSSQQEHKKKSEPRSLSCSLPEYSTHITCQQQHSQRRPPPPPPPSPPPPPPPSPPPPLPLRKSHKIPTRRRWSSATSSFYSPLEEQEWYWGNTSGSDYQKILEKITKRGCQPPPLPPKNSKIHKPLPPPPTHGEPPPRNILHEPPTRGCINTVVDRPLPQMSGTEEFDGHLIAAQLDLSRDMPHLKQSNLITAAQLNLSRDMPHLKESNWMNPSLSREESRKRLTSKCNGTFLVRPKAGVDDGSLLPAPTHSHTIDIIHQGIFKRIPIFRDPNGGYGFSPPYEFDSLSTLVLYYATNTMEKHNPDFETTLMYPAFCP